jgi:hypothetical protein
MLIQEHLPSRLRDSTDIGVFWTVLESGVDNKGLGLYFAQPSTMTLSVLCLEVCNLFGGHQRRHRLMVTQFSSLLIKG